MRIVVTGGDGFIGRNLRIVLHELGHDDVRNVTRGTPEAAVRAAFAGADFVYHLAGVNRPKDPRAFAEDNAEFTATVCALLRTTSRRVPLVYTSSTQALLDNPYGRSKRMGEGEVERYGASTGSPARVLRLTNVFGKWCRPNYNSAVATFCHNMVHGLPVVVHDASAPLRLLYIDDLIATMVRLLEPGWKGSGLVEVNPVYETTVGDVVAILRGFAESRRTLVTGRVGAGLTRALYATYLSYLPPSEFGYELQRHADTRGVFVEMLRTPDCGQLSYFTALPGVTRGEHYHHSKTEKFLVVKGTGRFGFRNILTGERHEIVVDAEAARIVETVPGWAHNITNVGDDELVAVLWANEVFDPGRPDTVGARVAL